MYRNSFCRSCCLVALILWGLASARADMTLVVLPTLGGTHAEALAVSNTGIVVGDASLPNGIKHAFVWDGVEMIDLGTLPDELPGPYIYGSWAYAVNDAGIVVGQSGYSSQFFWLVKAFRVPAIAGAPMESLGTLAGSSSAARAINNAGVIVGNSTATGNRLRAFRYTDTEGMVELPGWTENRTDAYGINNLGDIVGSRLIPINEMIGYPHAVLWPADGSEPQDLGTLGGTDSTAWAVSDAGIIVGESLIAGNAHYHAFRKVGDAPMEDLGALEPNGSSFARDINNLGWIVGWNEMGIQLPNGEILYVNHASLWKNGSWIDLHTRYFPENWDASYAWGINDLGWIVGTAVMGLESRAWILIPEPATLSFLLPFLLTLLTGRAADVSRRVVPW